MIKRLLLSATLLPLLFIALCCKPIQEEDDDGIVPVPVKASEDIILPDKAVGEPGFVSFRDENGKDVQITAYPGRVMLLAGKGTSVFSVWEAAGKNGGTVIGQLPDCGCYLFSVKEGKEADFIDAMRKSVAPEYLYPEFPVSAERLYTVDVTDDNHDADVKEMMKGSYDDMEINVEYAGNDLLDVYLGLIRAVQHKDADIINMSLGVHYGTKKGQKYGDDELLNTDYIIRRAVFWRMVCWIIDYYGSGTPVVVSAGNDSMHELERILGLVDHGYILGERLFIVCAEQRDRSYSNSLGKGERRQGVVTVNIDGDFVNGRLAEGTSFAAPKFCRFCYELVKATKGTPYEMTYAQAAKYLNEEWIKSGLSSITNDWKNKILRRFVTVKPVLEGMPGTFLPQITLTPVDVSFEPGLFADESWNAESKSDWIVTEVKAEDNLLNIWLNGNPSTKERQDTVTVFLGKGDEDDLKWDFIVTQEGVYMDFVTHSSDILENVDYNKDTDLVVVLGPEKAQENVRISTNLNSLMWTARKIMGPGLIDDAMADLNISPAEDGVYVGSVTFPDNDNPDDFARLTEFVFSPEIEVWDFNKGAPRPEPVYEECYGSNMQRSIFAYQIAEFFKLSATDLFVPPYANEYRMTVNAVTCDSDLNIVDNCFYLYSNYTTYWSLSAENWTWMPDGVNSSDGDPVRVESEISGVNKYLLSFKLKESPDLKWRVNNTGQSSLRLIGVDQYRPERPWSSADTKLKVGYRKKGTYVIEEMATLHRIGVPAALFKSYHFSGRRTGQGVDNVLTVEYEVLCNDEFTRKFIDKVEYAVSTDFDNLESPFKEWIEVPPSPIVINHHTDGEYFYMNVDLRVTLKNGAELYAYKPIEYIYVY